MRKHIFSAALVILVAGAASCTGEGGRGNTITAAPIIETATVAPTAEPTAADLPTATADEESAPTAEPSEPSQAAEVDPLGQQYEQPGDYLDSLMASGLQRWFIVHLPPQYEPGTPMPVVFNLHGRGSNNLQQRAASQMDQKADEEGFIVVYPQSLGEPTTWFGVLFGEVGQPDMDFFEALVAYVMAKISVDPERIYGTGISNGATMVNRLGCDMSEVFAAVAPVAGAHSGLHLCEIEQPVSMLAVHGTEDQIIPFEGGGSEYPSVHTWVEAWAERNGCQVDPVVDSPFENVSFELWEECDAKTAVGLYAVDGGGHTWLGLKYEPSSFQPEVGATDVIWDFFEAHPKSSSGNSGG